MRRAWISTELTALLCVPDVCGIIDKIPSCCHATLWRLLMLGTAKKSISYAS